MAVKNCGAEVQSEVATSTFMNALESLLKVCLFVCVFVLNMPDGFA